MKNLFLLFTFIISSCAYQQEKADLVIHNASIYTVDEKFSVAQAMAVKAGKIIAIGSEREILNKYSATEYIDAMKRPVYPGLIDAHCHFLDYGESLQKVNLAGTKSFKEVIARVLDFNRNQPSAPSEKNLWLTGRGWDQNDWESKEFPDKSILDSLFPDIPVFLKRIDGHAALANSSALKIAGISSKTTIPGGIIKLENNEPTGILIDNAVDFVEKKIPSLSPEQKAQALADAQQNCVAVGLTTVDDAGLTSSEIRLIDDLQKSGKLKMRVYAMLDGNDPDSLKKYLETKPFKSERLTVNAIKIYADGALGSRGALLLEEYSDNPNHYGLPLHPEEYLSKSAEMVYKANFQLCTHAIGDSANRMMLGIYARVLKGTNDKRWRIEHAQVVHPDDLMKFSEFNIIPSVQPTHASSDMYWAEERLGEARVKHAYAYKDLYEQNKLIVLGTDFPVEGISPIRTFYAAVFRMDEHGFPADGFQMENALTREEALKGMTIYAAIANFEENEKGSLEPGKFADFVILDTDLMSASPEQILKAKVVSTFINGEKVY